MREIFFKTILVLTILLSGCGNYNNELSGRVLLGNIAKADISIYKIDQNGLKTLLWKEKSTTGRSLDKIGLFNAHLNQLERDSYYLYEVSGGYDWDYNDDGVKDLSPTKNNGTFHSLIKGSDITQIDNKFNITYLSEVLYQAVKNSIGSDNFDDIYEQESKRLLAKSELKDLNKTQILKKIYTFFPAKHNVELNSTIFNDKDKLIKSIVDGNVVYLDKHFFKSVSLASTIKKVAPGMLIELNLELDVKRPMQDIISTVNLVNNKTGKKIELSGSIITDISSKNHLYSIETLIPNDVKVGTYHLEVILDKQNNIYKKTKLFEIVDSSIVTIGGFVFDSFDNNLSTNTNKIATKNSIEMSYDDGNITINSTLKIENRFNNKEVKNIKLSGYIEVDTEKFFVPFEAVTFQAKEDEDIDSVKPIEYKDVITIPLIEPNTTLYISTNLYINRDDLIELLKKLGFAVAQNPDAVLNANIVIELKTDSGKNIDSYSYPVTFFMNDKTLELLSDNLDNLINGIITVDELLAKLDEKNIYKAPSNKSSSTKYIDKLEFKKSFSKSKYGKRVGAGIYAKGLAYIDEDGIHTLTTAKTKIKVLKKKHYEILDMKLLSNVNPGSFDDTGYDLVVKSLGYTIFIKNNSLADVTDLEVTEEKSSKTDSKKTKKVKKAKKYQRAKNLISTTTAKSSVGYAYEKSFGKVIAKKSTIVAGFIPVVVEVGARATLGYIADIHLEGIAKLQSSFTPNIRVGSWIDGGVGAGFSFFGLDIDYSAGVGGNFWLLSDDFKNSVEASLDLVSNDTQEYIKYIEANLKERIRNYFYGPHGRLYLYGKWFGPKNRDEFYKIWKWSNHKRTKTLAKWATTKQRTTLLNKQQNLFRVQLIPNFDASYPDIQIDSPTLASKNILFAHGLNSNKELWNRYVDYAQDKGWHTYRTDVEPFGSIQTRATALANYINSLNLEDNSLLAVGHSMGGLDLRYIVSRANKTKEGPFLSAAKKIAKIYTIATPHGGNKFADIIASDDKPAIDDLSEENMFKFNQEYPVTTLKIDSRVIPLLAIRAVCSNAKAFGTDGVVGIDKQSLDGSSYVLEPFIARHSQSADAICTDSTIVQTEDTEILDKILNNGVLTDNADQFITTHRDIIFYSDLDCKGDVVGKFNSYYSIDIDCSKSDECQNNKASSILLFPNVKQNTIIRVYDHPNKKTKTKNYTTIYRGDNIWEEPVCITGFQHSTSAKEEQYGIKTIYNKKDSTKKLNKEVSHIRIWNAME